jgi:hypothetical protein
VARDQRLVGAEILEAVEQVRRAVAREVERDAVHIVDEAVAVVILAVHRFLGVDTELILEDRDIDAGVPDRSDDGRAVIGIGERDEALGPDVLGRDLVGIDDLGIDLDDHGLDGDDRVDGGPATDERLGQIAGEFTLRGLHDGVDAALDLTEDQILGDDLGAALGLRDVLADFVPWERAHLGVEFLLERGIELGLVGAAVRSLLRGDEGLQDQTRGELLGFLGLEVADLLDQGKRIIVAAFDDGDLLEDGVVALKRGGVGDLVLGEVGLGVGLDLGKEVLVGLVREEEIRCLALDLVRVPGQIIDRLDRDAVVA